MTRLRIRLIWPLVPLALAAAGLSGCLDPRDSGTQQGDVFVPTASHGNPESAPVQPIEFSHKIHAGINKIPCLYCHQYADRSPIANIPAVSTCMNCHRFVSGSTPEYQALIEKLRGYADRGEPIPWVNVHRVPDHVFFNHKRHVKAGLACQACHGPIEQMGRVYQYSSLKMGWCVRCHKANLRNAKFATSIDCYTCHK